MVEEIEAFFEHYNRLAGKEFRPLQRSDAKDAMSLVKQAVQAFSLLKPSGCQTREPCAGSIVGPSSS